MALPKAADIRALTDEQITEQIAATRRELFDLRFRQATRQSVAPHDFKHRKHRLAQLLTIERERQLIKTPRTGRR
jgi:large subunit ribosomal protein L29